MSTALQYILVIAVSYLIGSVSTGIIVSEFFKKPDPRKSGSKSSGATNVNRVMGTKFGAITFLGDCLKAVIACLLGRFFLGQYGALAAGLGVVIGHNWPVFFQFKGGKGVASSVGVMAVCYPIPALICYVLTIALIAATKYVSLGSMFLLVSFAVIVIAACAKGDVFVIIWAIVMALLCIWRHRANISRLIHGTENKFHLKK